MSADNTDWNDILEKWIRIPSPSPSPEASDSSDSDPTTRNDVHEHWQLPTIPPHPLNNNPNISQHTHTSDGPSAFSDIESHFDHPYGGFSMSQSSHISHTFPSSIVQAPKTDYAIIQRQDYVEDSPIHADGRSLHAEDAILSTATIDNNSASSLTDWASAASQPLSQQKGSKSTASPQDIPLLSQPGRSDSGRPSVSHSPTLWVYGIMPRRKAALKAEQRIATQLTALSSCDAEVAPLETLIHNPKKRRRTATRPDDTDVCSFSETSPKRRRVLQRGQDEYNPIAQDAPPEINEHAATLQPQNDLYLDNIRSPGDYVRGECDYRRYAYAQIHGPVLCSFCFEDPERSGTPGRKSRKSKKSKRSEHHRSRTLSRLPDVGYRHLKKCVKFKQSKYYKEKTHGSKTPWTIEGDIVKDAVAAHMMVVRLPCQRNPAYLARVALFQGIQPENVEQHAAKYATIFKLDDCTCCPYPLYSAEAVQKLGRRGASGANCGRWDVAI